MSPTVVARAGCSPSGDAILAGVARCCQMDAGIAQGIKFPRSPLERCGLTTSTPSANGSSCCDPNGEQRCLVAMGSDLEAPSRNPTDDSFEVVASQLAALIAMFPNGVFLSS